MNFHYGSIIAIRMQAGSYIMHGISILPSMPVQNCSGRSHKIDPGKRN